MLAGTMPVQISVHGGNFVYVVLHESMSVTGPHLPTHLQIEHGKTLTHAFCEKERLRTLAHSKALLRDN